MKREDICKWIDTFREELSSNPGDLPQEGDMILWDGREAHTTGDTNDTDQIRQTFYHAYLIPGIYIFLYIYWSIYLYFYLFHC